MRSRFIDDANTMFEEWSLTRGMTLRDSSKWSFKLSVRPERDNILKAVTAIRSIPFFSTQQQQNPILKIFIPRNLTNWDGAINGIEEDLRGQEILVCMSYQGFFTIDYYKKLMLNLWQALEKAEVEVNYITPPLNQSPIECESGVLAPIFYGSDEKLDSKSTAIDPLAGLTITLTDCQLFKITKYAPLLISFQRIIYQHNHLLEALRRFREDLNDTAKPPEIAREDKEDDQEELKNNFKKINFLSQLNISAETVHLAIANDPARARKLYRKAVHIQNEQQKLSQERRDFLHYSTIPIIFEENFTSLWSTQKNDFENAKSLLEDYFKKDYWFIFRFLYLLLHARSHVQEVQTIVNNTKITSTAELMTQLNKIKFKNPNGTLVSRMHFILKHSTEIKRITQPEEQKGDFTNNSESKTANHFMS